MMAICDPHDQSLSMRIPLPFSSADIHIYAPGSSRGRAAQQAQQRLAVAVAAASTALGCAPQPPGAAPRAPRQHRNILGFRFGAGVTSLTRALATYANAPTVSTSPDVPKLTEDTSNAWVEHSSELPSSSDLLDGPRRSVPSTATSAALEMVARRSSELRKSFDTIRKQLKPQLHRHAEMGAMLTALYEECSGQAIELNPFDASLDRLLGAASKACGLYVDCFRDTSEGLKLLREGMDSTPYLSDIAPEHRPWLCIDPVVREDLCNGLSGLGIDASKNPLLPLIFDNEPGYLHDMARAWQRAMTNVDQKVTGSDILGWHAAAKGLASGAQRVFKRGAQGLGLVMGRNASDAGMQEVEDFVHDSLDLYGRLDVPILNRLSEDTLSIEPRFAGEEGLSAMPKAFAKVVDHHLDEYYRRLSDIGEGGDRMSMLRRMYLALDTAQLLERTHPLPDGNCRSFCVLLLARLLAQQKRGITMIDNPNKLDGMSRAECFQLVLEGRERVEGWRKGAAHTSGLAEITSAELEALERWLYPLRAERDRQSEPDASNAALDFQAPERFDYMPPDDDCAL
jgi:hypothetical protein